MQSNIEIEAKVLLTKEQYENLLKYLHLERYKKIEQTNHYIDSTNRVLKKSDIALRIRENNDFVLTLKTPLSEGLLEKNQNITWREYSDLEDNGIFPQGDIKNFLEICGFNTRELKVLASLKTSRIELELDDGVLCLDENIYGQNNSITDYELEVESTSMEKAEETAKKILKEVGIDNFKFNTHSKQARAISAIKL